MTEIETVKKCMADYEEALEKAERLNREALDQREVASTLALEIKRRVEALDKSDASPEEKKEVKDAVVALARKMIRGLYESLLAKQRTQSRQRAPEQEAPEEIPTIQFDPKKALN